MTATKIDGKRIASVCPHDCPSACALEVEKLGPGKIGRIHGSKRNPYIDGLVCEKVARYAERVHHPDRLATPLRRTGAKGSGEFEPVSWDAALDEVAENFQNIAEEWGPEAVWPYYYGGTMGLVSRTGINRLRHVMGYSRQAATICVGLAHPGFRAGAGIIRGTDAREMVHSDLIVMWGGNPVHSQVHVMHWVAKARRKNGAKFAVVDPYRTPTAQQADIHLALKPGTDGALACAVMHVAFAEGLADRDYLAKYTDCPERLEAHLKSRGPAWAAPITGLGEQEIVDFALTYAFAKASYLRLGYGFTRSRNGAANMHAVSCLPAVTGAWAKRGGGALYTQADVYGIDRGLIDGEDAIDETTRMMDMCRLGSVLAGDPTDLGNGPPVKAMLVQHTNPAVVAPDSALVHRGLARDDLFLCVHEQFMTDTAKFADIVLPATTFLEHDDIYLASGHTYLQAAKRVIEPHGEARSNHDMLCALARKLGARHAGFEMTAWELADATLRRSGHPGVDEVHAMGGLDCRKSFDEQHFLDGFGHADGKFRFAPDWAAEGAHSGGMPELPDHWNVIDNADDQHPFRMITPPSRSFLNTSFNETPTSRKKNGRPTVLLHPDVCRDLGLADGDKVRIGNERGEVRVHVKPFDGLQPDVLVVEGLWTNGAFDAGEGMNFLTSADHGAPWGGAVFHDTAVWVRAD